MTKINHNIVFFEYLNASNFKVLREFQEDCTIFYFNIDKNLQTKRKVVKLIEAGKIKRVPDGLLDYDSRQRAVYLAHSNLEYIFQKYYCDQKSIREISKILNSEKISFLIFKKGLLYLLNELYLIELEIIEVLKHYINFNAYFYPENYFNIHKDKKSILFKSSVKVIYPNGYKNRLKKGFEPLLSLDLKTNPLMLFYPIYLLFKKFKGFKKVTPAEFQIAISIKNDKRLFQDKIADGILLDQFELPPEKVLFLDESGNLNTEDYNKYGLNFVRLRDERMYLSPRTFWNKFIINFFPKWIKIFFYSFVYNEGFIETKRIIFQEYIIIIFLMENYQIKNYIKRIVPDNITRTALFEIFGVKTWFLFFNGSSTNFYLNWNPSMKNDSMYTLLKYDYIILYGYQFHDWFKKHRNSVNKYFMLGCIYSQVILEIKNRKIDSTISKLLKEYRFPKIILGVFDTSYEKQSPYNIKDGINFANDIIDILNDIPELGVVFKAKKELMLTPALKSAYLKLKKHPRCLFFERYNSNNIFFTDVIAFSDLVISAAFTSPSVEALGARKKAIYYDVSGKFKGDGFYYDRFPNFVAHSYEDLKRLINYWLYEVSEEEFDDFLNTYVKDEIDPYLDGKALTRLRKLLMSDEPPENIL